MSKTLKIILAIILAIILLFLGLVAGGMLFSAQGNNTASYDDFMMTSNSYKGEMSYGVAEEASISEDMFENNSNEKLVYTGSVNIGTEELDESYNQAQDLMKSHNAFIENINRSEDYISLSIRVPKDKFLAFYHSLSEISGTITDSNINVENYTKSYKDNERRIDILQTEYDELKELLQEATNVEEILAIKDRMSYVTYDLESLTAQNNEIDYDVEYSILELRLRKVGNNVIEDTPFGRQVKDAFKNSLVIFKTMILGLINIWWILVIPIIIVIIYKKRKTYKK